MGLFLLSCTYMNTNTTPEEKTELHPRNAHRRGYDFEQLIASSSELAPFVSNNKYNNLSIDFSNPAAVKALNKALLKFHYKIENWDIPTDYLCPPIPGRADYIHYMADLLGSCNDGIIPTGKKINVLDIGVGANCIYPLIGHQVYDWNFIGSDIDHTAIKSAQAIARANKLDKAISCRLQINPAEVYHGLVESHERFDFTMSNPPFHASLAESMASAQKKLKNLGLNKSKKPLLNFSGQNNELWCKGGEETFVKNTIEESALIPSQCFWFSTLVSKGTNLPYIYKMLDKVKALQVKTINMAQGQKISRIVAWTFLTPAQQEAWAQERWK